MDRENRAVSVLFAVALSVLAVGISYTAIKGLLSGKVYSISRFFPGHYETGVSGTALAISYLIFSVGLVLCAGGIVSQKKGHVYMSWFKKVTILAGIVLAGVLLAKV